MSTPYDQNPYQPPGQPPYSVGTALSWAWERFRANPLPFVLLGLLMFVVSVAVSLPFGVLDAFNPATMNTQDPESLDFTAVATAASFSLNQTIGQMLSTLVSWIFSAALIKGALDTTRGATVTLGSMFEGLPWLQVIVGGVIVSIASTIGFFLCILPGFVVLLFTMWVNYFIIGRGEDAITALKSSFNLVKERAGESIIAAIVAFVVVLIGACLCGIGLLVTVPLSVLLLGWSWRTLLGEPVA